MPNTKWTMIVNGLYNPYEPSTSSIVDERLWYHERGQLIGRIYRDYVTISSYDRPIRLPFYFMETNNTANFAEVVENNYDAIVGLLEWALNGNESFLNICKSNGLIRARQYSVSFGRKNEPGKLLIGATNRSLYEGELNLHESEFHLRFELEPDPIWLKSLAPKA